MIKAEKIVVTPDILNQNQKLHSKKFLEVFECAVDRRGGLSGDVCEDCQTIFLREE